MAITCIVNCIGTPVHCVGGIEIRGLVSTGAAGAFAPAEIFNGCNAPVLRGIVCTKDLKSKETLGNLWLLEDILHPSCRDPNEAPVSKRVTTPLPFK